MTALRDEFEALMPEPKWFSIDTPGADFDLTFVQSREDAKDLIADSIASAPESAENELITPLYTADQLSAAMQAVAERAAKKEREDGAVVAAYAFPSLTSHYSEIRVERVPQATGAPLWAVRRSGDVLNKQGEWEWEPMPSGRDEDFLARARFATADEAIAAAIRAREGKGDAG